MRTKLTISEVKDIQKVGQKQIPKLSFKANNEWYFTFSTRLFEFIKQGQTIDCDVRVREREWEGNTYTDRQVIQIYDERGQGVVGGGKSGYGGKSPEQIREERISIEGQSALYELGTAIREGLVPVEDEIVKVYLSLLKKKVLTYAGQALPPPMDIPTLEATAPLPIKPVHPSPVAIDRPVANLGELFSRCRAEFGMTSHQVIKELGYSRKEDVPDAGDAYEQIKALHDKFQE